MAKKVETRDFAGPMRTPYGDISVYHRGSLIDQVAAVFVIEVPRLLGFHESVTDLRSKS